MRKGGWEGGRKMEGGRNREEKRVGMRKRDREGELRERERERNLRKT